MGVLLALGSFALRVAAFWPLSASLQLIHGSDKPASSGGGNCQPEGCYIWRSAVSTQCFPWCHSTGAFLTHRGGNGRDGEAENNSLCLMRIVTRALSALPPCFVTAHERVLVIYWAAAGWEGPLKAQTVHQVFKRCMKEGGCQGLPDTRGWQTPEGTGFFWTHVGFPFMCFLPEMQKKEVPKGTFPHS